MTETNFYLVCSNCALPLEISLNAARELRDTGAEAKPYGMCDACVMDEAMEADVNDLMGDNHND